jgi:hypothetical protein
MGFAAGVTSSTEKATPGSRLSRREGPEKSEDNIIVIIVSRLLPYNFGAL